MFIKAVQKYTRQTPRKLRLVANAVKDLSLEQAVKQLSVMERKASQEVGKVIRQAVANAVNNHGYQVSDLSIERILVNEGPRFRRFQAVSRGRAHNIIKRTSYITVVLKTADEAAKIAKVEKTESVKETAKIEKKDAKLSAKASQEKEITSAVAEAQAQVNAAKKPAARKAAAKGT
jgi:large subunit ribosomal protein L22